MNKKEIVKSKCEEAIKKIEAELLKPDKKVTKYDYEIGNFDIPKGMLSYIKDELKIMIKILDKNKYAPQYSRRLLEYPDTEIKDILMQAEYLYMRKT